MGLSAWKQFGRSRWALRVNPSSGNLHPTETYVVRGGRVWHYAVREHALEERCVVRESGRDERRRFSSRLSSIHWREAWKYGERAFRYCQHDVGHAIGALRFAAALLGWRLTLLPRWSDAQIAALLGLDRDADYARRRAGRTRMPRGGDTRRSRRAGSAEDPSPLVGAAACRRPGTAGQSSQLDRRTTGRSSTKCRRRRAIRVIRDRLAASGLPQSPNSRTCSQLPHRRTPAPIAPPVGAFRDPDAPKCLGL